MGPKSLDNIWDKSLPSLAGFFFHIGSDLMSHCDALIMIYGFVVVPRLAGTSMHFTHHKNLLFRSSMKSLSS
jgi:hypothetical protein